ncbi:hypothetical protein DRJ19_00995 [Candidatus Woesearchaeota archaeon]|nr:MAG: hypothetical protein DRJ19_00995 [Candidatus Woesearchaeota archaeon]
MLNKRKIKETIKEAEKIYKKHFKPLTWFERAIFFSWYCSIADCKFCYMSTKKGKVNKLARRRIESMLAELLVCKLQKWQLGFISGGHNVFRLFEFKRILKDLSSVAQERLWINVGALTKKELEEFMPYLKGVVASIETPNKKIHRFVCPSKPIAPFKRMLKSASELGIERAMTIIIGLSETEDDFALLEDFIREHDITKIHIYALNPQKGTIFENKPSPNPLYHAWWIAKTRIAFPKIDIQAGIWLDKVKNVSLLLKAGANSLSKFPAIRYFNSQQAKEIEHQAKLAGRCFIGSLTRINKNELERYASTANQLKIEKWFSKYISRLTRSRAIQ